MSAPVRGVSHQHLVIGKSYRVVQEFKDYDEVLHPVDETWVFLGSAFIAYHDGLSFFVSRDGLLEWQIRMRWTAEEQGPIIANLSSYIQEMTGQGVGVAEPNSRQN